MEEPVEEDVLDELALAEWSRAGQGGGEEPSGGSNAPCVLQCSPVSQHSRFRAGQEVRAGVQQVPLFPLGYWPSMRNQRIFSAELSDLGKTYKTWANI